MLLAELPPELLLMCLIEAVTTRGLRLGLVNSIYHVTFDLDQPLIQTLTNTGLFAQEAEKAIFASRLADKSMLDRPCHFWETYIVYWAMSGIHESSVFNIIYRVAFEICQEQGETTEAALQARIKALASLAIICRIEEREVWQGSRYKEDHFDFHLMTGAAYLDRATLCYQAH